MSGGLTEFLIQSGLEASRAHEAAEKIVKLSQMQQLRPDVVDTKAKSLQVSWKRDPEMAREMARDYLTGGNLGDGMYLGEDMAWAGRDALKGARQGANAGAQFPTGMAGAAAGGRAVVNKTAQVYRRGDYKLPPDADFAHPSMSDAEAVHRLNGGQDPWATGGITPAQQTSYQGTAGVTNAMGTGGAEGINEVRRREAKEQRRAAVMRSMNPARTAVDLYKIVKGK